MRTLAFQAPSLDKVAIGLSGLCLAHCVTTAVVLAVAASAGSAFLHPIVHEAGLALAMIFAGIALVQGYFKHGFVMPLWVGSLGLGVMMGALTLPHDGSEVLFTVLGVMLVALGHDLNRRGLI